MMANVGPCPKFLGGDAPLDDGRERPIVASTRSAHCQTVSALITNEIVLIVNMRLNGTPIYGALLDGGSGVNILSTSLCAELGISKLKPAPFVVKMADERQDQR